MLELQGEISSDPILEQVYWLLRDPARWHRFINLTRERYGWRGSYRQATTRVCQWLDESDPHHFPAESLHDVVTVTGSTDFLDSLWAEELRLRKQRRRPVKVEPGRRRKVG